jgi:ElaB/YqjD/DUF883 family membrane-anchored ribosome-binding protein
MRKLSYLIVFAALSLISTTTFAQEEGEEVKAEAKEMLQQEKVEVKLSELPEAVTKTLSEQFEEYTAEKAYKGVEDEKVVYYIHLIKEGENIVAAIDADGNVIIEEDEDEN